MKNYITLMTAAAIVFSASATAIAGEQDESVVFKYDASAPVEQTYEVLTEQAIKACKDAYGTFAMYGTRKCVKRSVNEAIEKINSAQLIAFHKGPDGQKTVLKLAEASPSEK